MENIRPGQEETIVEKPTLKKETKGSQPKEYDTFINILTSVVQKYGDEVLEEIDSAV